MKFLSKLLIVFTLSFSLGSPTYAWHSKMSMKETAAWVTVGGVVIVVTSPLWLTALVGFGTYKLVKSTKNKINSKLFDHSNADSVEVSAEDAARIIARQKTYDWLQTLSFGIMNIQRAKNILAQPEEVGLNRLQDFIKSLEHVQVSEKYDIGPMLCSFRTTFHPNLEGELQLEDLRSWISEYDQYSIVPENYLAAAKNHLNLSTESAKKLFGVLYTSLKGHGISLDQSVAVNLN